LLKKLLRDPIAVSRARSLLAYLFDMSRRSLRGSLHSGRSLRFFQQTAKSDRLPVAQFLRNPEQRNRENCPPFE
jgi:hypothetical protein